jgi:uncharacterized protein YacL
MVLTLLRALFILLMAAAGWYLLSKTDAFAGYTWLAQAAALSIGVLIVCIDILSPRRKLQVFVGTFLGIFVGLLITYTMSFVVNLILPEYFEMAGKSFSISEKATLTLFVNLIIGLVSCYLCISFVLQTRDDFRFIVPYVEFKRDTKGHQTILLDTSALIDGRVLDVAATGIVRQRLIVARFVLDELHALADSQDKLKRSRGRRGIEILGKLQAQKRVEVILYDSGMHENPTQTGADQKLLEVAKQLDAEIMTTDFNLNKVAQLQGVHVINLNDLADALRPTVLPGDQMTIQIVKSGEEAGQGVGYLPDGTMVVIESAEGFMNRDVEFVVTKLHQTSAGRMIFGKALSEQSKTGNRLTA